MRKHRFLIRFSLITAIVLLLGISPSVAAVPKVGDNCTKAGSKSGSLVCAPVNGLLKWIVNKKTQTINFAAPQQISVETKSIVFAPNASSKLIVVARSLTPKICTVSAGAIKVNGSPGACVVLLTQKGNAIYLPAPSVTVEIKILGINTLDLQLPGALLLSQNPHELVAIGSSSAPIIFSSETPAICTVAGSTLRLVSIGVCRVSVEQASDAFFPAAKKVTKSVEISTDRVSADLPDTVVGFQVKAIYVVPSDGTDNSYDINGEITMVLNDGLAYLRDQLEQEIQIDSTAKGFDIGFLRSSKPSSYFLSTPGSFAHLLSESKVLEAPGSNRKNYIFFVDTDTIIDSGYCGEAPRPGMVAVVAIGRGECGKQTNFFTNYASQTWVHEIFHNFGVDHVPDSCDLMTSGEVADGPTCPPGQLHTIDVNRNIYVGASTHGADITKLRIWKGFTENKGMIADCAVTPTNEVDSEGFKFSYCPTGVQTIGPASYCWTNVESVSLEHLVGGSWVSLGVGTTATQPWGERVDWKCKGSDFSAPTIQISVDLPGVVRYRWVVNGKVAEEMKIIWVN